MHCVKKIGLFMKVKRNPQLVALSTVFRLFLFKDVVECVVCAIRDAALLGTGLGRVIYS